MMEINIIFALDIGILEAREGSKEEVAKVGEKKKKDSKMPFSFMNLEIPWGPCN